MAGLIASAKERQNDYYARARTTTKPSPTLFCANVPKGMQDEARQLFADLPGFETARFVRGMAFFDFCDVKSSTSALLKMNGRNLRTGTNEGGLVLDYDKDKGVASQKVLQAAKQERKDLERRVASRFVRYGCAACLNSNLPLISAHKPLNEFRKRSDGETIVLPTHPKPMQIDQDGTTITINAGIMYSHMVIGEKVAIKKKNGVEQQFRMNCKLCNTPVVYRDKPEFASSKFTYVIPGAVTLLADKERAAFALKQQAAVAAAATAAAPSSTAVADSGSQDSILPAPPSLILPLKRKKLGE